MPVTLKQDKMQIFPGMGRCEEYRLTLENFKTFGKITESFLSNFEEEDYNSDVYAYAFLDMVLDLCQLPANDAFVDVSRKKRLIVINFTLDDGLFLSVAKNVDDKTNVVMYSVSRNHKTLAVGEFSVKKIVEKTKQVLKELKETNDRLG